MAQKKPWETAEDAVAKQRGATPTPRSGAGSLRKGDCYTDDVMSEVKSSLRQDADGPFIVVQAAWFRKVKFEAQRQGLDPEVVLVIGKTVQHFFSYRYAPFSTVLRDLPTTITVEETSKLHLTTLQAGVPALIIDNAVWEAYAP